MKFILYCIFLFVIPQMITAKNLEVNQLYALVDGAVIPFLQCNTNMDIASKTFGFEVVIMTNSILREKLSKKYATFSKCLKFESDDAIFWQTQINGQTEGYIDKKTGQRVRVDRFEFISSKGNNCLIRWSNIYASLGAFSKIVTLVFEDNKWVVVDVKQETVS